MTSLKPDWGDPFPPLIPPKPRHYIPSSRRESETVSEQVDATPAEETETSTFDTDHLSSNLPSSNESEVAEHASDAAAASNPD